MGYYLLNMHSWSFVAGQVLHAVIACPDLLLLAISTLQLLLPHWWPLPAACQASTGFLVPVISDLGVVLHCNDLQRTDAVQWPPCGDFYGVNVIINSFRKALNGVNADFHAINEGAETHLNLLHVTPSARKHGPSERDE